MTRGEQIINAAKEAEKENTFHPIVAIAKGVNSAYGIGFLEGAKWADKTMIDRACEWLEENLTNNPSGKLCASHYGTITKGELIKEFKKAMEE